MSKVYPNPENPEKIFKYIIVNIFFVFLVREAAKKIPPLMVGPFRGGGGKGRNGLAISGGFFLRLPLQVIK